MRLLEAQERHTSCATGKVELQALCGVHFDAEVGSCIACTDHSGRGNTVRLNRGVPHGWPLALVTQPTLVLVGKSPVNLDDAIAAMIISVAHTCTGSRPFRRRPGGLVYVSV